MDKMVLFSRGQLSMCWETRVCVDSKTFGTWLSVGEMVEWSQRADLLFFWRVSVET